LEYYRNGHIEAETTLLSENPDIIDGEAIEYSQAGTITSLAFFNNGQFDINE